MISPWTFENEAAGPGWRDVVVFFFRWCSMYGMPTCGSNSTYFVNRYTIYQTWSIRAWYLRNVYCFWVVSDRVSPIREQWLYQDHTNVFGNGTRWYGIGLGYQLCTAGATSHLRPANGWPGVSFRETPWKRGAFLKWRVPIRAMCAGPRTIGKCWSGIAGGPDVIEIFGWIKVTPGEVSQNGEDLLFLSIPQYCRGNLKDITMFFTIILFHLFLSLLPRIQIQLSHRWRDQPLFAQTFLPAKRKKDNAESGRRAAKGKRTLQQKVECWCFVV